MGILAYWLALAIRFCHTSYHFLLLHWNPPHYGVSEQRWRGDGSLKSMELRCSCGRLFFKWWSDGSVGK